MRDSTKSRLGWLWVLPFLALPDCSFNPGGLADPILDRGPVPRSSVIFCDIEKMETPRRCATPAEVADTMMLNLSQGAVALAGNQSLNVALDFSPSATASCGGQPQLVTFFCGFPEGCPACINCGGVIGPIYADVAQACRAFCEDLNGNSVPAAPDVVTFCAANARPATNASSGCFAGACTDDGALRTDWEDPRRVPEPVGWTHVLGATMVTGNSLTKTGSSGLFDAGAASMQLITGGDAFVEFTVSGPNVARACGLSTGGLPDLDPSLDDIDFAVRLTAGSLAFVFESGMQITTPTNPPYVVGDKVRLKVTDNHDGTATIAYFLLPQGCAAAGCPGMPPIHTTTPAAYPFRVDASLRDLGAELSDVRIVRNQ